jgi:hypothetical protein
MKETYESLIFRGISVRIESLSDDKNRSITIGSERADAPRSLVNDCNELDDLNLLMKIVDRNLIFSAERQICCFIKQI